MEYLQDNFLSCEQFVNSKLLGSDCDGHKLMIYLLFQNNIQQSQYRLYYYLLPLFINYQLWFLPLLFHKSFLQRHSRSLDFFQGINSHKYQILQYPMIHSQAKPANIVLDVGTYHTFAGEAGYQSPKFAAHSYLVNDTTQKIDKYCAGKQALTNDFRKQISSIFYKMGPDAKVDRFQYNMDKFDKYVEAILFDNLDLEGYNISVLLTEDVATDLYPTEALKQKQKMLDYLLQKMQLSSVAFVKKPVLTAFALGRSTAVVLDSGHSFTSCSIVEDGYCVFSKTLNFGGSIIHNLVRSQIQKKMPNNQIWKIGVEKQQNDLKMSDIYFYRLVEIEKVIKQFPYLPIGSSMVSQDSEAIYTLPDNHKIKIKRKDLIDPFINYQQFWHKNLKDKHESVPSFIDSSFYKSQPSYRGLQQFVFDTIDEYLEVLDQKNKTCIPSVFQPSMMNGVENTKKKPNQLNRQDLLNNIILTGGNFSFSDLAWSVEQGIRKKGGNIVQSLLRFNKDTDGNPCSIMNSLSWIGGSIVCNLPVFNHFWIKNEQWKHQGIILNSSKNLTVENKVGDSTQQMARRTRKTELITKKFP